MTSPTPLPRPIAIGEFEPLLGRTLMAACDPRPVPLELVEVTPLTNHARLDRPPFVLVFRSAPDALLMAGTYILSGDGFGPDLVDLGSSAPPPGGGAGHYYQAVFN